MLLNLMIPYFSKKEIVILDCLDILDLTMTSLMSLEKYQHLRAASFYEQQKLCRNCFLALTKIEYHRMEWQNLKELSKKPFHNGFQIINEDDDGIDNILKAKVIINNIILIFSYKNSKKENKLRKNSCRYKHMILFRISFIKI